MNHMATIKEEQKDDELIGCTFKPNLSNGSSGKDLRLSKSTCSKSTGIGLGVGECSYPR
jgi:hypothetical protein